jgi:hypothetical protein
LTEPLSGKEHQARQRANEVEGEVESLTVARALLAIKATLGSDRAAEELSALDDRVSNLTEEAVRLEAQAAKARSDAELRKPADERGALKEEQGLEERILEVTNTRRQRGDAEDSPRCGGSNAWALRGGSALAHARQ